MSISESFKNAVQNLRRELKRVAYPQEVDYAKVAQGEPEVFLPILHHAFVDYSLPLSKHITENCKVHLAGKTDNAFISSLYSLLRDEFSFRPPITADQFFKRAAFAEKKTVMCIDLLQMVRERHKTLSDSIVAKEPSVKASSSTSKLAETSIVKPAVSSRPASSRVSNIGVANSSVRRSFYVAPSSARKETAGPNDSLGRVLSQSTEELKPKGKKSEKEAGSQSNVSVSNGVRIVVEKHGVNAASRRSVAPSTEFKVPLKTARPVAVAKETETKEKETKEPKDTQKAEEEELLPKDRRKTMFASYSTSMASKLERARNGKLSSIAERKVDDQGDKENGEPSAPPESEKRTKTAFDVNNNKASKKSETKRAGQSQPVVVTTIDKTVLETILARLELAETRLRFAERNVETLMQALQISQQSEQLPVSKLASTVAVETAQNEIVAMATAAAKADVNETEKIADADVAASELNDTDVPFASEVVLGESAANYSWRDVEADSETL